jgi:hypothetical protein
VRYTSGLPDGGFSRWMLDSSSPCDFSHRHSSRTPAVFYTCSYDHALRLRLEKLLCLELPRSPNGFFQVLLGPGGGFTSETVVSEVKQPPRDRFGSETVTNL